MGYRRKINEKRIAKLKINSTSGWQPRGYYYVERKGRIVRFRSKSLKDWKRIQNKKTRRDFDIYVEGSYFKNKVGNIVYNLT